MVVVVVWTPNIFETIKPKLRHANEIFSKLIDGDDVGEIYGEKIKQIVQNVCRKRCLRHS